MHLSSRNIRSDVILKSKCDSNSLDDSLIETEEAILLIFTKAFVRVCQMHMEYLFRLSQANSVLHQSLKVRGGAKLVEEISYNDRNLDFMIDVSRPFFYFLEML